MRTPSAHPARPSDGPGSRAERPACPQSARRSRSDGVAGPGPSASRSSCSCPPLPRRWLVLLPRAPRPRADAAAIRASTENSIPTWRSWRCRTPRGWPPRSRSCHWSTIGGWPTEGVQGLRWAGRLRPRSRQRSGPTATMSTAVRPVQGDLPQPGKPAQLDFRAFPRIPPSPACDRTLRVPGRLGAYPAWFVPADGPMWAIVVHGTG